MLAMVVNDDAYFLNVRGVLETIASMLAPTGDRVDFFSCRCQQQGTVAAPASNQAYPAI